MLAGGLLAGAGAGGSGEGFVQPALGSKSVPLPELIKKFALSVVGTMSQRLLENIPQYLEL